MAMESLLPLFQEGGAPEQDPVLSQLMDPSAQDDLFSDLLGVCAMVGRFLYCGSSLSAWHVNGGVDRSCIARDPWFLQS